MRRRRTRSGAITLLALAIFFFGCGKSDELPDQAAAQLRPPVSTIRAAAAAGDRAGAQAGLDLLRQTVADLQRTGGISDEQASDVLAAAAGVEAQLVLLPAPPPPPPPPPPPEPPQDEGDEDNRGKGKGHKNGDD